MYFFYKRIFFKEEYSDTTLIFHMDVYYEYHTGNKIHKGDGSLRWWKIVLKSGRIAKVMKNCPQSRRITKKVNIITSLQSGRITKMMKNCPQSGRITKTVNIITNPQSGRITKVMKNCPQSRRITKMVNIITSPQSGRITKVMKNCPQSGRITKTVKLQVYKVDGSLMWWKIVLKSGRITKVMKNCPKSGRITKKVNIITSPKVDKLPRFWKVDGSYLSSR